MLQRRLTLLFMSLLAPHQSLSKLHRRRAPSWNWKRSAYCSPGQARARVIVSPIDSATRFGVIELAWRSCSGELEKGEKTRKGLEHPRSKQNVDASFHSSSALEFLLLGPTRTSSTLEVPSLRTSFEESTLSPRFGSIRFVLSLSLFSFLLPFLLDLLHELSPSHRLIF